MIDKSVLSWWLARGFALLPCQHDKKFLVKGYGQHQSKITNTRDAVQMFSGSYNLAVCGHGGTIILDFDDAELYKFWRSKNAELATTYTEITPRGGAHVFIFGRVPELIELRQGVELKRVCMVYPSTVNGKIYTRGAGEILEGNTTKIFSSLSKTGTKTAYVLGVEQNHQAASARVDLSLVDQIKQKLDIEQIFTRYRPEADLSASGRYVMVRCPFHDDQHASMFLDRELQIFKCHACGVHGDAINLYARFSGKSNAETISILRSVSGVRS